jgi:hypothetical protein
MGRFPVRHPGFGGSQDEHGPHRFASGMDDVDGSRAEQFAGFDPVCLGHHVLPNVGDSHFAP